MRVKLGIAASILFAGVAQADVYFYNQWNCKGNSFHRSRGSIANLKQVYFSFTCWKERYVARGEIEIPYLGTCHRSFNDDIYSVWIEGWEKVKLFKHTGFRGSSEYLNDGPGCYNLRYLPGEASSLWIE